MVLYIAPIPPDQCLPSWYQTHSRSITSPGNRAAVAKSLASSNTPHVDYFDAIDNRIAGIDDNGTQGNSVVSYNFDIQGNQLQIVDALGRTIIKCDYSISGEVIHSGSMEFGSATVELDDQGQLITCEKYFPYGTSSYQAVASQTQTPKCYRYASKERDEESGLYYYGARYYAPWLGRWTSCDSSGFQDSLNIYAYCCNSPAQYVDADGRFKFNKEKFGEGLKDAAIGLAVGFIIGAAFLSGIGEAALLIGASEVTFTAALEYAGAAGAGLGIASLFKSGMDIGTGEDAFAGKKLDDNERSRRLGSFDLELPATVVGVAGIAGPRPPTGTLNLKMPEFPNPFAKTPEGFLLPASAPATAIAPATTLIRVTAPVAAGGGGLMGIIMASHGGGGGGSSGGGGASSNNNAGSGGSAMKIWSPSSEGEQQPFKLPPKSEEDKAFLVKPQELLVATDAEVMKFGSDPKYLEETGVGSWQIEQMQKGGYEWLMRMVKGSANESAFKLKLLDDPTLGLDLLTPPTSN